MPAIVEKNLSIGEFIGKITKLRRIHKNQWVALQCALTGCNVSIKFHNTYIQKLVVDGIDHTPAMEETVKAFNAAIVQAIQYAQYEKALDTNYNLVDNTIVEGGNHDNQG